MSEFETAAEQVKNLSYKPTNDELLQLYALYKQATVGDNETARPGMFDLKGKAKWDAWAAVKGTSTDDAKSKYVALVKDLQGMVVFPCIGYLIEWGGG